MQKPEFLELYKGTVVKQLQEQFNYNNVMEIPKLTKITLNMGVGQAVADRKKINFAVDDMTKIAGQQAIITLSRISVAGFKIRNGWPIGCKVTLRGARMYDFMQRLVCVVLPRVRDFRGLNAKSFDGRGNFSMGLNEQIVFPEIDYDKVDQLRGLDITMTTTARTDEEALALFKGFMMPFRGHQAQAQATKDEATK